LQEASEAWTARAHQALQIALSVSEPPERSWVSHWAHALPLIDDPHRERVKTLEQALAGSSVTLSGSAFHGSGIDAAVRSAERVAAALGP
jgi:oxygen-dependent protoporphyrinogen oxidase